MTAPRHASTNFGNSLATLSKRFGDNIAEISKEQSFATFDGSLTTLLLRATQGCNLRLHWSIYINIFMNCYYIYRLIYIYLQIHVKVVYDSGQVCSLWAKLSSLMNSTEMNLMGVCTYVCKIRRCSLEMRLTWIERPCKLILLIEMCDIWFLTIIVVCLWAQKLCFASAAPTNEYLI